MGRTTVKTAPRPSPSLRASIVNLLRDLRDRLGVAIIYITASPRPRPPWLRVFEESPWRKRSKT